MKKPSQPRAKRGAAKLAADVDSPRERILEAAMCAFMERGYAETSTLEIATRARVSKRELYALFGSKAAMLEACIGERVAHIQPPSDLPVLRDRDAFAVLLERFGAVFLKEICRPEVVAVYRLAIAEARRSPQVARTLDLAGQRASRDALCAILAPAQAGGIIAAGDLKAMAREYFALLWADLILGLLLRLGETPDAKEIAGRASRATDAFLRLHGALRRNG
jgi:AcrR family transcriptional regulator